MPWYRKNWYAIICALLFTPGLIPPLLTGNFYYQKNGVVTPYSKFAKVAILIWAVVGTIGIVSTLSKGKGSDDKAVSMVKSGSLEMCPGVTVEQMVNGFMGSPSWKSGVGDGGVKFVNVSGKIKYRNKTAKSVVQFIVNETDGTFEYGAFEINELPQPKLIATSLMEAMCESASTPDETSENDEEEEDSSEQYIAPSDSFLNSEIVFSVSTRKGHTDLAPSGTSVAKFSQGLKRFKLDNGKNPEIFGWTKSDNEYTLHFAMKKSDMSVTFVHLLNMKGRASLMQPVATSEGDISPMQFVAMAASNP